MSEEKWDGHTERRKDVCPFHQARTEQIEELERSKVSFTVLKILISIILIIGGAYWYHEDMQNQERFKDMLEVQSNNTQILQEHVRISGYMLRRMSDDIRETKLNLEAVMKKEGVEYQRFPEHHDPED